MYQSAFCAAFMDQGFPSKRNHDARLAAPALDSPCARAIQEPRTSTFRIAENSSKALAGNAVPNVHTERAFGPTARQANKLSRGTGRTSMHDRVFNDAKKIALAALLATALTGAAHAQKKYDPGATDTEIKVGNIMPYSGPASAYATIGKTEAAYFNKINSEGGINGRKINFISYDDAYSPPKAVEQARKLVESDEVLLIFNPLGTPSNSAIQKYMNAKKVPQLFVSTGAAKWNDPKNFPWTMGWQPNYQTEARIYAAYILKEYPGKTIGILYQNDDFGKDYVIGLRDGLGDQANKLILIESSYETTSPTVDSQVVQIKGANPDIFFNIATPKFAAQAIKKIAELNWHPVHFLTNVSGSIGSVMKPAGYENDQGILTTAYLKDPKDPDWKNDPVMKQAANLNFEIGIYLPGTKIKTSPTDFAPLEQLQMMRFKGETWERFGPVMSGEKSS